METEIINPQTISWVFFGVVGIMIILGVFDLMVGVSNDAVNFTNSAVAAKITSRNMILIVAGIGVLIGALSSSGMMEVARKGIFHPDKFTLVELMMIFTAVMITDIILLDMYNTFGLPTSTTVSLVFELLGAAAVMALWKTGSGEAFNLINAPKALQIISGIFLSVLISFLSGAFVLYIIRLIYSHNIDKTLKKYGGLFAGLCISIIILFLLIKGLKKTAWFKANPEIVSLVKDNMGLIFLGNFAFFGIVTQILFMNGVKVLNFIILLGTGALAMAFAGNDLVNFIGVPIAGFEAFSQIVAVNNPLASGDALAKKIPTQDWILIVAGMIMVVTLWRSKKSMSMSKTEISIGSQAETIPVFESNTAARVLVSASLGLSGFFRKITPNGIREGVSARFTRPPGRPIADYDPIRASVNIMVASSIIMVGTLMKLPLSTTFVTFMVAMGTSMSDRVWGRDNAVERVSGVLTVIGGWFMTAAIASITAGLVVSILYLVGLWATFVLFGIALALVYVFSKVHKERQKVHDEKANVLSELIDNPQQGIAHITDNIVKNVSIINGGLDHACRAMETGKQKHIRRMNRTVNKLSRESQINLHRIVSIGVDHFQDDKDLVGTSGLTNAATDLVRIVDSFERITQSVRDRIRTYNTTLADWESADIESLLKIRNEICQVLFEKKGVESLKVSGQAKYSKKLAELRSNIQTNQIKQLKLKKSKVQVSMSYLRVSEELVFICEQYLHLVFELNKVKLWVNKRKW